MRSIISIILGFAFLFNSCKEDNVVEKPISTGGFHTSLNGWNYAGTVKNSIFGTPGFTQYKLHYGNTFNNKVDVIYQIDDILEYPTTQTAHRLILNPDGSTFFHGKINVSIFQSSALESSSQEIKRVYTTGLLEDDTRMILELKVNLETITSVIHPKYQKDPLNIFTTSGDELSASDLSSENGFFSHSFLLKPLYKGDAFPITLDETQGTQHVAAYVEADGGLTFASIVGGSANRALSLFKSLEGLENVDFGYAYKGPVHRAVPKHHLPLSEVSEGDAGTKLSRSDFIRKDNKLYMLLGFTNGTTRLVEVDRENLLLKVKPDLVYPGSVVQEKWLGMRADEVGTLYTIAPDPFAIKVYTGKSSSVIPLPDFKSFSTMQGGVIGVTYNEGRLYLMVYNVRDLYIYTKDI